MYLLYVQSKMHTALATELVLSFCKVGIAPFGLTGFLAAFSDGLLFSEAFFSICLWSCKLSDLQPSDPFPLRDIFLIP